MHTVGEAVRFLVDSMLGTLAKWLRILGYDAAYQPDISDDQLIRQARAEGRALLTRDRGLLQRKGVPVLLIESDVFEEQLEQALQHFDLGVDQPFTRCPVCNTPLERVPKSEARGQVPPYVFQTQEHFKVCPECDRFYWRGTHWRNMLRRVKIVRE